MGSTAMISTVAPHQDMDITLFVGGASCGKSRLAEACAEGLAAQRLYIATMRPQDAEARHKVARHRARRDESWQTVEAGAHLCACLHAAPEAGVLLLDSLGTWISGMLCRVYAQESCALQAIKEGPDQEDCDQEDWGQDNLDRNEAALEEELEAFFAALPTLKRPLIVVSEEAGLGLVPADPLSRRFRDILGRTNQRLAACASGVHFVSCGLALRLK